METQLVTRLAIEEDLRGALDRQEFELLYQPLWDLNNDRVCWIRSPDPLESPHPRHRLSRRVHSYRRGDGTDPFHRGLGREQGLRRCHETAPRRQGGSQPVCGAVRHGRHRRHRRRRAGFGRTAGKPTGAGNYRDDLLNNNDQTIALLLRLHALGLRIALDDFGTGYSSLSYLRSFPFDKIKIDQSFVREMLTRPDCAAIVSSIVTLANKLNITTTAEGIETIEQLQLVRETGCTEAQGYLFSVPRPLRDVLDYFAESVNSMADVQA